MSLIRALIPSGQGLTSVTHFTHYFPKVPSANTTILRELQHMDLRGTQTLVLA